MRHSGRTLLAGCKIFFSFTDIGTLQVTDFGCHLIQRGTDDCQSSHEMCMTVTLDNLGCQAYRSELQLFADIFFYKRIDVGVSAYSTGQLADCHHFTRLFQTFDVTLDFSGPQQEFHTEGHRFCVDAVGTADHNGIFEFSGTTAQNFMEVFQMTHNQVCGLYGHVAQCSILYVTGGQAFMNVFGRIANIFSHISQESNNIMVGNCFNFLNAVQTEVSLRLNILQRFVRHNAQFVHSLASQNFYLQHGTEFVFECPDITHFRMSITINHFCMPPKTILFMKKHLNAHDLASDSSLQFDA